MLYMSESHTLLTLSTCWYNVKSKFTSFQYLSWIQNFFSIVNNFNLVIYTDVNGFTELQNIIHKYKNILYKKIKIIIKPITDFYGYKYKEKWIHNHKISKIQLHNFIDWQLNMLWCEKIHFVKETIDKKYFETPVYGWCDIGYFRNEINTTNTQTLLLGDWPKPNKLFKVMYSSPPVIHYSCVQNNVNIFNELKTTVLNHYFNTDNKTKSNITNLNDCFAGGFFILPPDIINQYVQIFDEKLNYYFSNNYVIKDDQTIIMDCIFTNPQLFRIHFEDNPYYNNWFMFQRLLL
jgi:hypothetical protein